MVMLNDMDRYHLVIDVIDRVPGCAGGPRTCASGWWTSGSATALHARHGDDPHEVRDWVWPFGA